MKGCQEKVEWGIKKVSGKKCWVRVVKVQEQA